MNFVCTVFEQGDEMLTLLSMEKNNGRMQPKGQTTGLTLSLLSTFGLKDFDLG